MFLANSEDIIVQNIIDKLTLYMKINNQSTLNMAKSLGFSYQNLNWLIKHKRTPTIGSLVQLCELLNCNLMELIANEFFLDVQLYDNVSLLLSNKSSKNIRIYIPKEDSDYIINNQFFVMAHINNLHIYHIIDQIIQDGEYLVNLNKEIVLIKVLFSSSKMLIIEKDKKDIKIPTEDIKPIAKLYKPCVLLDDSKNQLCAKFLSEKTKNA